MHTGLSICQTKYCKTTFLASPCLCYILFNRPVVGKTALLRQKSQQTHYYYRIATKLQKHIKSCCCSFNKVPMKKKTLLQENFDLTINFEFFDLITWDSLMV